MLSILIEGTVCVFILTSIIYFKSFKDYISQEFLINLGFAHIGLLLISSVILGF